MRSSFLTKVKPLNKPTQFLVDNQGKKIAVVVPVKDYEEIMEQLEELEEIRAFDEAKASGEIPVPFEEAVDRIRKKHRR
jgi:PHD/YefM family antitoxin component YafN of YafNO toxin-antitoxin module